MWDEMPRIVWDETTYPFLNSNSRTDEVWEWIINFISHVIMDVTTSSYSTLVKGTLGDNKSINHYV